MENMADECSLGFLLPELVQMRLECTLVLTITIV